MLRWIGLIGLVLILLVEVSGCKRREDVDLSRQLAARQAEQAASAAASRQAGEAERCLSKRDEIIATYEKLFGKRLYEQAASAVRECAAATKQPVFTNAVAAADIADYRSSADDPKTPLHSRILVLDKLYAEYPEAFKGHEGQYASLQKQQAAAEGASKRKRGVTIGMSKEDVLASNWGKPRKINRSTYAWGSSEQWVYDGGYLYFKDGVLESIQH